MIHDPNFEKLQISQKYVSIFASGFSIDKISPAEYQEIYEKTYVIGTNYFYLKYLPHLLFWSDTKVSYAIDSWLKQGNTFSFQTCARDQAFFADGSLMDLRTKVDFWFNREHYGLAGNFTLYSAMALVKKFHPGKKILLFGVDFDFPADQKKQGNLKYYDNLTPEDKVERSETKYLDESMLTFRNWLQEWVDRDPWKGAFVHNCNIDSKLDVFQKSNWREVVLG